MTNYDKLTKELREVPLSWLPALCLLVVEEACKRKVFASPEAMKNVLLRHVDKQNTPRVRSRPNNKDFAQQRRDAMDGE
jgi:hypothetical protein